MKCPGVGLMATSYDGNSRVVTVWHYRRGSPWTAPDALVRLFGDTRSTGEAARQIPTGQGFDCALESMRLTRLAPAHRLVELQ
jgi:hypothetical protein